MASRPLLEGPIHAVPVDELDKLSRENEKLREKLRDMRAELSETSQAVGELLTRLRPLREAMQVLFDEGSAGQGHSSQPVNTPNQPIPESMYSAWKQRLPPSCGRVIDALLIHPMSFEQIKRYAKMGTSTLEQALAKLRAANLIEKEGGLNRLRRL